MSQRTDCQIVSTEIQKLQQLESNKLVLTAAQHLDCIRSQYPELAVHMGLESQTDSSYNSQKISECEEKIRNILENLQSLKCDFLE